MPSGPYADMIERLKPGAAEAGDIVDLDGQVLGRHSGIIHFTVGQRRGLGIATGAPLYVVRLDAERAASSSVRARRCAWVASCLRDVNWIGDGSLDEALADDRREVFVKVRSTRPPQAAWLRTVPRAARSNWSMANTAYRRARPACSTMPERARRACSAADSSRARSRAADYQRADDERMATPVMRG